MSSAPEKLKATFILVAPEPDPEKLGAVVETPVVKLMVVSTSGYEQAARSRRSL